MATPDPVTIIKFQMEQQGLTRKDLEPMIGSRGRVSEVLTGKRSLTLPMIRRLLRLNSSRPEPSLRPNAKVAALAHK